MTQATLTRSIKQALVEGIRENRDEFRDLLAEVIEDVAMTNAIREGEKSKPVKRAGYEGANGAEMTTSFLASFLKDVKKLRDGAMRRRVADAIRNVEEANSIKRSPL